MCDGLGDWFRARVRCVNNVPMKTVLRDGRVTQDAILDTILARESVWTRTGVTRWTGLTPELPQITASVAGNDAKLFVCFNF